MNSYERELKEEKLKNNLNRQHLLKILAQYALLIDLISYTILECIDFAFCKFHLDLLLACFVCKVRLI